MTRVYIGNTLFAAAEGSDSEAFETSTIDPVDYNNPASQDKAVNLETLKDVSDVLIQPIQDDLTTNTNARNAVQGLNNNINARLNNLESTSKISVSYNKWGIPSEHIGNLGGCAWYISDYGRRPRLEVRGHTVQMIGIESAEGEHLELRNDFEARYHTRQQVVSNNIKEVNGVMPDPENSNSENYDVATLQSRQTNHSGHLFFLDSAFTKYAVLGEHKRYGYYHLFQQSSPYHVWKVALRPIEYTDDFQLTITTEA